VAAPVVLPEVVGEVGVLLSLPDPPHIVTVAAKHRRAATCASFACVMPSL
jgi:hypothetical protein